MIYGKFLAWDEGRSRKHETDIYDMLVFKYLSAEPEQEAGLDEEYLDALAAEIGPDVGELWGSIKQAARAEATRPDTSD